MSTSICEKIAGTLNESDFARFERAWKDEEIRRSIEKNATVKSALLTLVNQPIMSSAGLRKEAEAWAPTRYNVVQVRPSGYGYLVKFSAAPDMVDPQQVQMDQTQAQQALPPEALQAADQTGAATMTDVQAGPDPMEEPIPEPADKFGMYKVRDAQGREIVGYVIPGLFDPHMGGPTGTSIFVNGGQYAIAPQINGKLIGLSYDLPSSEYIRGLGIFYKTDGKSLVATVPYTISSEITVEGQSYYAAQNEMGQELQITISPGLKGPVATSPEEIVIPDDFHFLALDNPIQLEGMAAGMGGDGNPLDQAMAEADQAQAAPPPNALPPDLSQGEQPAASADKKKDDGPKPQKLKETTKTTEFGHASKPDDKKPAEKKASVDSMIEIRAWDGGCDLRGPVLEKIGSGTHTWADGLFWMAATGIPQNYGLAMLEKAAQSGEPVRIFGVRALTTPADTHAEAQKTAQARLLDMDIPQRVDLLREALAISSTKEAAHLVGTDTVDSVLSLNFINPENISTFVEELPKLETAATKLASLVLATQLGLQNVPETAAVRAMFALEDVIDGLKSMKNYHM